MKSRFTNEINIKNKQASFQFELIEKLVAGIALMGTEIKSIREGKVNLQDGFCYFNNGELFSNLRF
jgi:SsrA-binding protein